MDVIEELDYKKGLEIGYKNGLSVAQIVIFEHINEIPVKYLKIIDNALQNEKER